MFDASPRPELLALLAAVKAEPADDTPKLALADWLQEQDHDTDRARGEFLRELVRYNRSEPRSADWWAGREVLARQWKQYERPWAGALIDAGFRAGWSPFDHPEWALLYPLIDGSKVVTKAATALAGTETYAWVAGLYFPQIGTRHLERFAASPLLDSLIGLSFQGCNASGRALASVIDNPRAAGLTALNLGKVQTPIGSIASSPHLAKLRQLRCWFCQVTDAGFKELCDSPHLNELRELDVSNNRLSIHAARAFSEARGLPALTSLDLGGTNHIGPDGTLILVHGESAGRLRRLNLWSNGVADYGVEQICRRPHLCHLTHLNLAGNLLTSRAAVAIASAAQLATLEELNLRTNGISGEGALALAASPFLANLRRLDVAGNNIGKKAADALRDRFGDGVTLA